MLANISSKSVRRLSLVVSLLLAVAVLLPMVGNVKMAEGADPSKGEIVFTSYPPAGASTEICIIDSDSKIIRNCLTRNSFQPAWSPDGSKIAFVSNLEGNPEINVMNRDGTNKQQLTFSSYAAYSPTWSPDGTRIAFVILGISVDDTEIYTMNADGSNQQRLTKNDAMDVDPTWSPDGSQIAFASWRENDSTKPYVMNTDGTNQRRLANFGPVMDIDWSPDGTRIAFTSSRDLFTNEHFGDPLRELYVMNVDGTNLQRITDKGISIRSISWSPDSSQIVFSAGNDFRDIPNLYVIDADGSNFALFYPRAGDPDWGAATPMDDTPDAKPSKVTITGRVSVEEKPLVGVQVALIDTSDKVVVPIGDSIITTDNDGRYTITGDIPTGYYTIKVALIDGQGRKQIYCDDNTSSEQKTLNYSELISATIQNFTGVYILAPISISQKGQYEQDIDFSNQNLQTSLSGDNKDKMGNLAWAYYRSWKVENFVRTTLGYKDHKPVLLLIAPIVKQKGIPGGYTPYEQGNGFIEIQSVDYIKKSPTIVEHENFHQVMDLVIPVAIIRGKDYGKNHGGYGNDSTQDSWVEGWAEFWPCVMEDNKLYYIEKSPLNLETNYKSWDTRGWYFDPAEEFAVASLLWDLYDGKNPQDEDNIQINAKDIWNTVVPYLDNPPGEWETQIRTVRDLYNVLKDSVNKGTLKDVSIADLDQVFIAHGFYAERDIIHLFSKHDNDEEVGWGGKEGRNSFAYVDNAYLKINLVDKNGNPATGQVTFDIEYDESYYNYSYSVDVVESDLVYLELPPVRIKSVAKVTTNVADNVISSYSIDNESYWQKVANSTTGYVEEITLKVMEGPDTSVVSPEIPSSTFAAPTFQSMWQANTPLWGEAISDGMQEPYAGLPNGVRQVQYFEKSRMEINDGSQPARVTNGLLVREMIEGRVQVGDALYEERTPASEAIAGDPTASNPNAPTYATFRSVAFPTNAQRAENRVGQVVTEVLAQDGSVSSNADLARYSITLAAYDEVLGHNIPTVFTTYFATHGIDQMAVVGLPLSEPYWARVMVGGVEQEVLIQVFERRVITYNPNNPAEWQVEMGNVGRHYLTWRYNQ
jgi:Tol biopolymer transport system component